MIARVLTSRLTNQFILSVIVDYRIEKSHIAKSEGHILSPQVARLERSIYMCSLI